MEEVEIKIGNPVRLIQAISKIGYTTEVALCDLMDNGIDAKAKQIEVRLDTDPEGEQDFATSYIIADDGCGMDGDMLKNALSLGADKQHGNKDLGKFGLGLKSAGLSLGNKITIITKTKADSFPRVIVLDMKHIEKVKKYEVSFEEKMSEDLIGVWNEFSFIEETGQGTIVIVSDLIAPQKVNMWKDYFIRYCGIIYHIFMEDKRLNIIVNETHVSPIDPLFREEAEDSQAFVPDHWSGKTVNTLCEETDFNLDKKQKIETEINITHLIHPPTFGSEQNERREHYHIGMDPMTKQPRHGFYIYRNDRIIVLAERFRGLVANGQNTWAFRGALKFDSNADAYMDLDVKKVHCYLPSEGRMNLSAEIKQYVALSQKAWDHAKRQLNIHQGKGKPDALEHSPPVSLDYDVGHGTLKDKKEVEDRLGDIEEETKKLLGEEEVLALLEDSSIIIRSEKLGSYLWLPYPSLDKNKTNVLLNSSHYFTRAVDELKFPYLVKVFQYLIYIVARAEIRVLSENIQGVSYEQAKIVMENFRKYSSRLAEDMVDAFKDDINTE